MRILILGANQIAELLARNLVREDNDITLIGQDSNILQDIRSNLDIQTVLGNAASPNILLEAGIEQTDLVIAVTANDEVNMLACLFSTKIFKIPKTIALISSPNYFQFPELFKKKIIPIQTIIYPNHAILQYIFRLIKYPDFTQILSFCDNKICIVTIDAQAKDWLIGKRIADIQHQINTKQIGIIAVFKQKTPIYFDDEYCITVKDKILFITYEKNLKTLLKELKRSPQHNTRIMLAGGSELSGALAKYLESDYEIKLIEKCQNNLAKNTTHLNKTLIIEGDINDRNLLLNENIGKIDMFCAMTDDDENNIMAALLAKYLGAKYTMVLVNNENYIDLIDSSDIDAAFSPQAITIETVLSKIKNTHMVRMHHLQNEEVEAIEFIVEGTHKTSAIIGRPLSDIEFPPCCILAAVVRNKKLYFSHPKLRLSSKDHVIFLVLKHEYIQQLEELFAVNLTFMS